MMILMPFFGWHKLTTDSVTAGLMSRFDLPYPPLWAIAATMHGYEKALISKDTDAVVGLCAEDSVVEWNDMQSYSTREQKTKAYSSLFKNFTMCSVRRPSCAPIIFRAPGSG